MPRRYNTRRIKKHHNYSFEEIAEIVGVHEQTVRGWIRAGLRCMRNGRPFLVLGTDLVAFLERKTQSAKRPLAPNELYCLKCKTGRIPAAMIADYLPDGPDRGRLSGICPECENMCQRFVNREQIGAAAPNLSIEIPTLSLSQRLGEEGGGGFEISGKRARAGARSDSSSSPPKYDSTHKNARAAPEDLKEPGEAA